MKNKNSVAFVSEVSSVAPIEGADKIVQVKVKGWDSVSQKGIHKVGDRVICITTDAVIPQEFAEKHGVDTYLRKGFRVRTVKLRGVYSECILLPLGVLDKEYKEGDDLTETLGIFKYEPPVVEVTAPLGKKLKKSVNPNFYVYHKFPNSKNVPDMFTEEDYVEITRKWHGSNFRASISKKAKLSLLDKIKKFFGNKLAEFEFCYGSRTVQKFGKADSGFYSKDYWGEMVEKYELEKKLLNFVKLVGKSTIGEGVTIYGELVGEGIQGERYTYGVKGRELRMFDMTINGEYLYGDKKRDCFKALGLPMVELLYQGYYSKEVVDIFVHNQFIEGTKIPHEGVVVTSIDGSRSKIAKFINPDFLIYSEKYEIPDSH